MYRLRQMDVDDKVCEQVDVALLAQVYPKAVIKRWDNKHRDEHYRREGLYDLLAHLFLGDWASSHPALQELWVLFHEVQGDCQR